MSSIFLAYKTEDENIASSLKIKLKDFGHELKIEDDKAYGEGDWRKQLMYSLKNSDGIVALLTNGRGSQFISSEIGMARAFKDVYKDMFVIPVIIGSNDIPLFIQDLRSVIIKDFSEEEISRTAKEIHRAIESHKKTNQHARIFVSHRHKDEKIASALITLLEASFDVEPKDIRCTSVQPYTLPIGARTSERLRTELSHAQVVLGLMSPDTDESDYVLFELGAAWGRDTPTFPLLISGATIADVPSPLNERHCISLENQGNCWQLVDELRNITTLKHREDSRAKIMQAIEKLTATARQKQ